MIVVQFTTVLAHWKIAFEQLDGEWGELYLAEFPEVLQSPASPGSQEKWVAFFPVGHPNWVRFCTQYTRAFFTFPSPLMQHVLALRRLRQHLPEIAGDENRDEQTDEALRVFGAARGRDSSLERLITWKKWQTVIVVGPRKVCSPPRGSGQLAGSNGDVGEGGRGSCAQRGKPSTARSGRYVGLGRDGLSGMGGPGKWPSTWDRGSGKWRVIRNRLGWPLKLERV